MEKNTTSQPSPWNQMSWPMRTGLTIVLTVALLLFYIKTAIVFVVSSPVILFRKLGRATRKKSKFNKAMITIGIALVATISFGCASIPMQEEATQIPQVKTQILAGFIELYFITDEIIEIQFFTLEQEKLVIFSPKNPIVTGPDGALGLRSYLMFATYDKQPLYLVVEESGEHWILQQVVIDVRDKGLLEWEIAPPVSNTIA